MIAYWASKYVGLSYQFGGMDCWGLVCLIQSQEFHKTLPRFQTSETSPKELAKLVESNLTIATPVDKLEIGDLLIFKIAGYPCHVGVYVGDSYMLHTLTGHNAVLERYTNLRWTKRFEGAYRVN